MSASGAKRGRDSTRTRAAVRSLVFLGTLALAGAAAAETWRGLEVAPEHRCSPYDKKRDYPYPRLAGSDPAVTSTDGTKIVLTFTEAVSGTTAAPSDFTVTVSGMTRTVSAVEASDKTVVLTLSSAVAAGETITVSYTDPSNANDENAIQDIGGNDLESFSALAVTNLGPTGVTVTSIDLTSAAGTDETYAIGDVVTATVTLSEAVSLTGTPQLDLDVGGTPRTADSRVLRPPANQGTDMNANNESEIHLPTEHPRNGQEGSSNGQRDSVEVTSRSRYTPSKRAWPGRPQFERTANGRHSPMGMREPDRTGRPERQQRVPSHSGPSFVGSTRPSPGSGVVARATADPIFPTEPPSEITPGAQPSAPETPATPTTRCTNYSGSCATYRRI